MKRFEYEQAYLPIENLHQCLNRRGDNGWQLVSIRDSDHKINGWEAADVILMREVSDE